MILDLIADDFAGDTGVGSPPVDVGSRRLHSDAAA